MDHECWVARKFNHSVEEGHHDPTLVSSSPVPFTITQELLSSSFAQFRIPLTGMVNKALDALLIVER